MNVDKYITVIKEQAITIGVAILFVLVIFALIDVFININADPDYYECEQWTVKERIQSSVRVDSTHTKQIQFYKVECDNQSKRIQSNKNFPLNSTIKQEWVYQSP